jgi:hypothetical protein
MRASFSHESAKTRIDTSKDRRLPYDKVMTALAQGKKQLKLHLTGKKRPRVNPRAFCAA